MRSTPPDRCLVIPEAPCVQAYVLDHWRDNMPIHLGAGLGSRPPTHPPHAAHAFSRGTIWPWTTLLFGACGHVSAARGDCAFSSCFIWTIDGSVRMAGLRSGGGAGAGGGRPKIAAVSVPCRLSCISAAAFCCPVPLVCCCDVKLAVSDKSTSVDGNIVCRPLSAVTASTSCRSHRHRDERRSWLRRARATCARVADDESCPLEALRHQPCFWWLLVYELNVCLATFQLRVQTRARRKAAAVATWGDDRF